MQRTTAPIAAQRWTCLRTAIDLIHFPQENLGETFFLFRLTFFETPVYRTRKGPFYPAHGETQHFWSDLALNLYFEKEC